MTRALVGFFALVAATGAMALDDVFYAGFEAAGEIVFLSDQSAVLTQTGAVAEFEVEIVDANETPLPGASVRVTAPDDAPLSVEQIAPRRVRVTATGFELGSIPLRFTANQIHAAAKAHVLFAEPGPDTFVFSSAEVVSVDRSDPDGPYTVVLPRSTTNETLAQGDILVSGDRIGLLDVVTDTPVIGSDTVTLTTQLATLPDAFENFRFEGEGSAYRYESSAAPEKALRDLGTATCKKEDTSNAGLKVTDGAIDYSIQVAVAAKVEIVDGELTLFEVGPEATAKVNATTGKLAYQSQISGQVTCKLALKTFSTPALPVYMFSFQLGAQPTIGVKATASFDGPSFQVEGPTGNLVGKAGGGIRWSDGQSWSGYGTASWQGSTQPFKAEFDRDIEFKLEGKPFATSTFKLIANLGRPPIAISLAEVDFIDLEGGAPAAFEFNFPFDPVKRDYKGPLWSIKAKLEGKLKAALSGGVLQQLLQALKLGDSPSLGETNLFEPIEVTLLESPIANVTATCEPNCRPDVDETITLQLTSDATSTGQAEFRASLDEQLNTTEAGNATYSAQTRMATTPWQVPDQGSYEIFPRLAVDLLSAAFPYAKGEPYRFATRGEFQRSVGWSADGSVSLGCCSNYSGDEERNFIVDSGNVSLPVTEKPEISVVLTGPEGTAMAKTSTDFEIVAIENGLSGISKETGSLMIPESRLGSNATTVRLTLSYGVDLPAADRRPRVIEYLVENSCAVDASTQGSISAAIRAEIFFEPGSVGYVDSNWVECGEGGAISLQSEVPLEAEAVDVVLRRVFTVVREGRETETTRTMQGGFKVTVGPPPP